MSTGQPVVELVRRGIRWQLIGFGLGVALASLVVASATRNRLQAALLFLVGVGLVLDGRSLRANGALLAVAAPPRPSWIPWASGLAFVLGAAVITCAIVFFAHPRAAP